MTKRVKRKHNFRLSLYQRQGGLCTFCRQFMRLPLPYIEPTKLTPDTATFDHIYDKSTGKYAGRSCSYKEIILACYDCNQKRGRYTDEWAQRQISQRALGDK